MFKVNNKETSGANGVVLVSLLLTLTYFIPCSSVYIVDFQQVNAGWLSDKRPLLELTSQGILHYL